MVFLLKIEERDPITGNNGSRLEFR